MKLITLLLSWAPLLMPNLAQAAAYLDDVPNDIWQQIYLQTYGFMPKSPVTSENWLMHLTVQRRVKVENQWMWWHEARHRNKTAPILEDCVDPDYVLANLPAWNDATKVAVQNGKEPAYLMTITSLAAIKIQRFLSTQTSRLETKDDLLRHAYSVLFAVRAYHKLAQDAALFIARDAAFYAAYYPPNAAPSNFAAAHETGQDAAEAARNAAFYAAVKAARKATSFTDGHPARRSAYRAAQKIVGEQPFNAVWNAGVDPVWHAAMEVSVGASPAAFGRMAVGELAYRSAEKLVLISFARHAEDILGAAYHAAFASRADEPAENIFPSVEVWQAFKERHAKQLTPERIHFLQVWLDELDRIAKKLEEMDD